MVDTRDLKSLGRKAVGVRVPLRAKITWLCYLFGSKWLSDDVQRAQWIDKAKYWLTLAAEQADFEAQGLLGDYYLSIVSYDLAEKWYTALANQGDM